jgi:uncharacterized protein
MSYAYPGVYVKETATGARPIEAVGVSTAAFIGQAPDASNRVGEVVPITNWSQFRREFACGKSPVSTPLSHAVYGFFENGGSRCYVVNLGAKTESTSLSLQETNPGSSNSEHVAGAPDGHASVTFTVKEALASLESRDDIALLAAPGDFSTATSRALVDHCAKLETCIAILDAPRNYRDVSEIEGYAVRSDRGYGVLYSPWIEVTDPLAPRTTAWIPPSGHVAGVMARIDATRGVHKAPANEVLRGALEASHLFTPGELELATRAAINCIRVFPGDAPRIWGARTLAKGGEWKYVNVRRLFIMVRESIRRAMQWVVFEPNDRSLWNAITRDLRSFLMRLWREGALMGATPSEAFFVKCDAETNPPENVDAGIVTTVVGLAPVKPAEFVVFEIGQSVGGTEVTEETSNG